MTVQLHKYGLKPVMYNGAAIPTPIECFTASAYAAAVTGGNAVHLKIGDQVKRATDGSIQLAQVGDSIFGVIIGFGLQYDAVKGIMVPANSYPASITWGTNVELRTRIFVQPVQGCYFECDLDEMDSTDDTEAELLGLVGEFCDIVHSTTNSGAQGSDPMIDEDSRSTASGQWLVWDLSRNMKNEDPAVIYRSVIVSCNEPQFAQGVIGPQGAQGAQGAQGPQGETGPGA